MEQKTIKINPAFLNVSHSVGGKKSTTQKAKKLSAGGGLDNKLKRKLMSRIDEFKKKQMKIGGKRSNDPISKPDKETIKVVETSNFDDTLSFLQRLANENQNVNNINKPASEKNTKTPEPTAREPTSPQVFTTPLPMPQQVIAPPPQQVMAPPSQQVIAPPPQQVIAPPQQVIARPQQVIAPPQQFIAKPQTTPQQIFISPEPPKSIERRPSTVPRIQPQKTFKIRPPPPYGCIKGGKNPTYREWKRQATPRIHGVVRNSQHNSPNLRSEKLAQIKHQYKQSHKQNRPRILRKKLRTVKYKLGKTGDGKAERKISVLIKNQGTRKKIKHEHGLLQKDKITDVRNYLKKHNLIKGGSLAPNDVLKTMYESAILAGDVTNKSADTLLHNFLN